MRSPRTHLTEHSTTVDAPAHTIFDLIADVTRWPVIFPPSVHVEYAERDATSERVRIWATANDTVKGWTSRRELDRDRLRVRFRQESSQPPVAAMGGEWIVTPLADGRSLVRLAHDFQPVDDKPETTAWIERALDCNSNAELASLKAAAQHRTERDELSLTFDDEVHVNGAASDVYDFVNEAGRWPERLLHVAKVELTEDNPGVQVLEMDTRTRDGSTHTTRSVRICFPRDRIVYKQLRTPALLSVHTGQWQFDQRGDQTVVTSTHIVVLIPEAVPTALGPNADMVDAKAFVRSTLGRNSMATMLAAKDYAEQRRHSSMRRRKIR